MIHLGGCAAHVATHAACGMPSIYREFAHTTSSYYTPHLGPTGFAPMGLHMRVPAWPAFLVLNIPQCICLYCVPSYGMIGCPLLWCSGAGPLGVAEGGVEGKERRQGC